jgi:hypothetical protein
MDESFLKLQADRCRSLAEIADPFIKRRLLDLAMQYDRRSGSPSRAMLSLKEPVTLEVRLPEKPSKQASV